MKKIQQFIKHNLVKYPLFILVVFLTFLVREWYPFSFYPMYNEFPNWSYTFYLEDENQEHIRIDDLDHGSLSHLFYAEANNIKIHYGNNIESKEELEQVGEKIIENIFVNKEFKKESEFFKE